MSGIPVFLSSDNNYAPFVATTITSVCDHTKVFVDFYVLDGGISEENKAKICNLKTKFDNFSVVFLPVNLNEMFPEFRECMHLSKAAYNRFLIADLMPQLERAIYLDVDIVALGDIETLWRVNLEDKTLGMSEDTGTGDIVTEFKRKFGLNNYYNSGVLLIDLKHWKKLNYTQRAFDLEKKIHSEIKIADQDLFNILFKDDCAVLNQKFNVQYGAKETVIRHFVNVYKPWKFNYFKIGNKIEPLANFDDFWHYANMTDFKDELKENYEKNINGNLLNKRLSMMVEKMKGANP